MFGFITPSPITVMFVLGLGVLLFGKNLPEVARQVGLSLMEFKRGMNDLSSTLEGGKAAPSKSTSPSELTKSEVVEEHQEYHGTKFEPPQES